MRATLWIAASGFLLAAGVAYAEPGRPTGRDDAGYTEESKTEMTSPAQARDPVAEGAPQKAAQDVSKAEAAQPRPQEKSEASSSAVTIDPDHPGGEFPYGG